eukprot:44938_1
MSRCHVCKNYEFWYIFLCCIVYSLGYFYRNSVSAITDALQKDLETDASGIGLLSFLYASYFGMQLIISLLLEIYSYQLLLYLGSFGLGLTSFLFGLSSHIAYATIIRFVSGLFLAPLFLTGISIGAHKFGAQYVTFITGILLFSSQSFFSGIVAFQAYLYHRHNIWREVYYIMGALSMFISFLVGIMAIMELKKSAQDLQKISNDVKYDNKYAFTFHDQTPLMASKNNSRNNSSFTHSLIFRPDMSMSQVSNKKTRQMIHSLKRSMRNVTNWVLGVQQFALRSITYALNGLWIIAYLELKFGYLPSLSAIISAVFFISASCGSVFCGKMMQRYNKRKIFLVLGVFLSAACLVIIYGLPPASESEWNDNLILVVVILSNAISGFGCGFLPVGFTMARELNDLYRCGDTAVGMVNMIGNGAGFASQILVSNLIDMSWRNGPGLYDEYGLKIYSVEDYDFAFMLIPITLVLALVMSLITTEPSTLDSYISYSSFITSTFKSERRDTDVLYKHQARTELDQFESASR